MLPLPCRPHFQWPRTPSGYAQGLQDTDSFRARGFSRIIRPVREWLAGLNTCASHLFFGFRYSAAMSFVVLLESHGFLMKGPLQ
jgi:hypothetical protein